MSVTGINDQMHQYWRATEFVYNKPKHSKPHGIKRPDTINIMAVFTGLFVILVAISEFID